MLRYMTIPVRQLEKASERLSDFAELYNALCSLVMVLFIFSEAGANSAGPGTMLYQASMMWISLFLVAWIVAMRHNFPREVVWMSMFCITCGLMNMLASYFVVLQPSI